MKGYYLLGMSHESDVWVMQLVSCKAFSSDNHLSGALQVLAIILWLLNYFILMYVYVMLFVLMNIST